MRKEWRIFLTAIMYFTRIRVPRNIGHSPEYLQQSPRYFPMVGWIVGGLSGLVFWIFSYYISVSPGAILSMVAGILVTGAFHEDGFADVCDGFGGGWTKEKILLIMKDSRIGAFGAIGLICMLGTKFVLLQEIARYGGVRGYAGIPDYRGIMGYRGIVGYYEIVPMIVPMMMAAHSLSRLMPVGLIQWRENVTDLEHNKSKPVTSRKMTVGQLGFACVVGLAPFLLLPWVFLGVIIPAICTSFVLAKYFTRWIGGYTGDCLGALQQVSEVVIYMGMLVFLKYLL